MRFRLPETRALRLTGGLLFSVAVTALFLAAIEAGLRLERRHHYFGLRMSFFKLDHTTGRDPPIALPLDEKVLSRLPDAFAHWRDPKIAGPLEGAALTESKEVISRNIYRVTKKIGKGGPVLYEVTYNLDHGRRVTVGPRPRTKNRVLLLGCSFTYGEGLDGSQTLASQLQPELPNAKAETVASHGYGVSNLLYELRRNSPDGPYGDLSAENGVVAFYFFIPQHLNRVSCTLACHGGGIAPWMKRMPDFSASEDGAPVYRGTYEETVRFYPLLQYLADSAIVSELNLDWPPPGALTQKFIRMLLAYRDELAQKVNLRDFYFVYHPSFSVPTAMKAADLAFSQHGIKVLKPSLDFKKLTGNRDGIPLDRHPSNHDNFVLSRYLDFILERDHPEFTQARKE